ncbi:hypothetical protein BZG36_02429 [Bifiguratus adelaidae]|uniref:C2 NT-type domain-containing protein n=1 Tax=Bifiguratus adelaidae TaxID=1938954 RepID=A0A261Y3I9_9FUNG|nr:hypothetical protein BZG36_02429 [Bifiguratus adelaidae]
MPIAHLFVPKSRKVELRADILIHDLTNIPLVSGLYRIHWKIKHGDPRSGFINRAPLRDHNVVWNQPFESIVSGYVEKEGTLAPIEFRLDIIQELNGGRETSSIGILVLNLSEYLNNGSVTRRYLLQESKINSTLKITITVNQLGEDDLDIKTLLVGDTGPPPLYVSSSTPTQSSHLSQSYTPSSNSSSFFRKRADGSGSSTPSGISALQPQPSPQPTKSPSSSTFTDKSPTTSPAAMRHPRFTQFEQIYSRLPEKRKHKISGPAPALVVDALFEGASVDDVLNGRVE